MREHEDASGFIRAFTGSHRLVIDYLVEEVLQRQTPDIRSFLLATAVLDRLTGPLCEALTGVHDGGTMLEALERDNLFVVSLDATGHWYRYHHMFAEVLLARARQELPGRVPELHRLASEWYEQKDLPKLAEVSGLAVDPAGRLKTDSCLRSTDYRNIVGAGDAVLMPAAAGSHLRMGCAAALPMHTFAARTVLAQLRGPNRNPCRSGTPCNA